MKKSTDHPSVTYIKQKIANKTANKFSFRPINEDLVRGIVKESSINKAASGGIPVKLLKESEFIF